MPVMIGTSGYSYKDWKGVFYPESCKPDVMLAYYARHFDTVELNFSYYRQPEPGQLRKLAAEAGAINPGFKFALKAYRGMTHDRGQGSMDDARVFHNAAQALDEQGRLAAVLLQFPHSFHYTTQNRQYLGALLVTLEGLPLACEFRS